MKPGLGNSIYRAPEPGQPHMTTSNPAKAIVRLSLRVRVAKLELANAERQVRDLTRERDQWRNRALKAEAGVASLSRSKP